MPIQQARAVFEDAVRSFTLDSIVNQQDEVIRLQQSANDELAASYAREIGLLNRQFEKQKEITSDFVRLSEGWKKESEYYQKRYRKSRKGKTILTLITLAAIGWAAVK